MRLAFALIPLLAAFQDAPAKADPAAELKKLQEEYKAAYAEYYRPLQEAKTIEERKGVKLDPEKNPSKLFQPRAIELAMKASGTETGAQAHLWAVQLAQAGGLRDAAMDSIRTLVTEYSSSPLLGRLAQSLEYGDRMYGQEFATEMVEAIRDTAKDPGAKAGALLVLASWSLKRKETDAAREMLQRIVKEFPDTPAAKRADGMMFEADKLQIGMVAPDFEATDEKGQKFKLSDFRGKVTVIDFWGLW
jgi:TolA-binding protein